MKHSTSNNHLYLGEHTRTSPLATKTYIFIFVNFYYLSLYLANETLPCSSKTYSSCLTSSTTTPLGLFMSGFSFKLQINSPFLAKRQILWFLLSATITLPALSTPSPAGSDNCPGCTPEHPNT